MSLKLPLVSWNTSRFMLWPKIINILFLFCYEAIVLLIPLSCLLINCWKTYCFASQKISCTASFLSSLRNINALNINENQKNSYSPTSGVEMEHQWNLAHLANISNQRKVFKVKGHCESVFFHYRGIFFNCIAANS